MNAQGISKGLSIDSSKTDHLSCQNEAPSDKDNFMGTLPEIRFSAKKEVKNLKNLCSNEVTQTTLRGGHDENQRAENLEKLKTL